MRPEEVESGIVDIPNYAGGTKCYVTSITDRHLTDVYNHAITNCGCQRLMPDGRFVKGPLDREIDKALNLEFDLPTSFTTEQMSYLRQSLDNIRRLASKVDILTEVILIENKLFEEPF